ncbi:MAG: C40 family peptidase [Treponema sp.]|jgi:cell wall-associated NlpC family hydrolase|nr:C40 family peptidase [Treponema sp.]
MVNDLIGVPFKQHGRDKSGMDCLGLAIEVLKREGIKLDDVFYDDLEEATKKRLMESMEASVPSARLESPEKNCVIEFNILGQPSHIGVYLGCGEFIHASEQFGVVIDKLYRWKHKVRGYYRVNH